MKLDRAHTNVVSLTVGVFACVCAGGITQREDVGTEVEQSTATCTQHTGGRREWMAGMNKLTDYL